MNEIMQNFQFIRPLMLLAALPVLLIYILKLKFGQKQNLWQQLLPQHLYQRMVISKGLQKASRYIHYALFAWLLSVLAIAGPTWEKLPQAVYQTQAGKVILMDMSMSMRSTDLAPNRLTRARFKANDLLNQVSEGETGLVAYSGDAFVISPLTDDANTLKSLIPSLKPEIMPTQGSSALRGLEVAAELLANAGYQSGQIYWLTDGILYEEIGDIRRFIQESNFDVSALLVGTETGAPIQLEDGKLLKDASGSIVVPSINSRYLNQAMSGTDATYSVFASDNSDIAAIKRKVEFEQQQQAQEVENTTGDVYRDMGPYIVLLVLPFAAYAFRRGLMVVCVVSLLTLASVTEQQAFAAIQDTSGKSGNSDANQPEIGATQVNNPSSFSINNWFKNPDQRGKEAFDQENYSVAQNLFESPSWQAASAYKSGDYQKALDLYSGLGGLENTYNKANALAKLGKLQEALDAYNEVLDNDPEHENAQRNKAIVEELLKQQEQQSQDQQNQQDQENGQDSEQNQDSDQNSEQNPEQNSQQSDSSDQNGEQSEQDQQDTGEQGDSQQNEDSQSGESQNNESNQQDEDLQRQAEQEKQQQNQSQNQDEQNKDMSEQASSPPSSEQLPQELPQDQQQEAISADQFDMSNMTPEEKEEMQRMQMIMNKVPDDPAYLLQRKMMLEAYRRERQPVPTQEKW